MERGKVSMFGKCKGLYYVDNDFLDVYSKVDENGNKVFSLLCDLEDDSFEYDWNESSFRRDEYERQFIEQVKDRFPSFEYVNKWISKTRRALLENELFYIVCEDNQYGLSIELLQKEGEYESEAKIGLQMGLYLKYLKGIEDILLSTYRKNEAYKSA